MPYRSLSSLAAATPLLGDNLGDDARARIVTGVNILADAVKGMSASQFSRQVGIQYKTAFVLMHKIRASLLVENSQTLLTGNVQVDGAYFDTKQRKPNEHRAARERAAQGLGCLAHGLKGGGGGAHSGEPGAARNGPAAGSPGAWCDAPEL